MKLGRTSQSWLRILLKDISDHLVSTSLDDSEKLIGISFHKVLLQSSKWSESGEWLVSANLRLLDIFEAHCFVDNVKEGMVKIW